MNKYSKAPQSIESKKMITDALLELLKSNKYSDINISRICTKAKVSRITFYRNFDYKDDILRYYLEKISFNFNYELNIKDINSLLVSFYDFLLNYKNFLKLLDKNNLDYLLKENMLKVMGRFDLSLFKIYEDSNNKEFAFDFIVSTICSVLFLWIKHDFKETTNFIANLTNIFLSGITKKQAE